MLVALFIMSVTAAFVTVVITSTTFTRDIAYENNAFRIANSKLDELRALGYAALPPSGAFYDQGLANMPQGVASTSVTVWNEKTKEVRTSVSWLGASGLPRFVSLTTLVTEVGGL